MSANQSFKDEFGDLGGLEDLMDEIGEVLNNSKDEPSSDVDEEDDAKPIESIAGKLEYLRPWQKSFPWDV